jgi:hypothetical protein
VAAIQTCKQNCVKIPHTVFYTRQVGVLQFTILKEENTPTSLVQEILTYCVNKQSSDEFKISSNFLKLDVIREITLQS